MPVSRLLLALLCVTLAGCGAPAAPSPTALPTEAPSPTTAPSPTALPTEAPSPTIAASPTAVATAEATPATGSAGEQIDIGGRTLFLSCSGEGTPVVILEAGLGADHNSWALVQPQIAGFTRVCSYDRAGLGQSEPAPTPRTSAEVVADLHTLLEAAELPPPYVFVAHSFGALHTRLYAASYPAEVAGIVLADPVHEDYWQRALAILPPEAPDDSQRLSSFRRFLTTDLADPANNAEGLDIPASAALLREAGNLGNIPLIVLTAGIPDFLAPGLPADLEAQIVRLWQETLSAETAALSSDSTRVTAPNSGHNIPAQAPDLLVLAIRSVVELVRGRGSS